jgi:polar amino acid transport system substrate-binding protein
VLAIYRFLIALLALLLAACAGMDGAPTTEVRQALAPTGRLRVGVYPGSPFSMIRDPATGETKGLTVDVGKALAARLGVPYEAVEFQRAAEILAALKAGTIDVSLSNATPARAQEYGWTPPLLLIELGYLVMPGSKITSFADVDRAGIRVGVTQGGTSHSALTRELKNAVVVPASTLKSAIDMLSSRKIDAYATNKANLFEMSDTLPGSRVLDGRWGLEHLAMVIPKGREQALPYLRKFAEDIKHEGLVARAVAKTGLRGVASAE